MNIKPLASESLGVRSMATYVETNDCKILIDPSAALGPKRYGLSPHQKEKEALFKIKEKIAAIAKKCDIITISHYHYDHYNPNESFYNGKQVFAKDISKNINKSQKERGINFRDTIVNHCNLVYCDDSKHKFGDTEIVFSPAFFHGPENIRLGYIVMVTIDNSKKKLLHTSDVQGPVTKNATEYIIDQKPDLLIIDGPPTCYLGWRFSYKNLEKASDNLVRIIETLNCKIILDHHLLRDKKYKEVFSVPYNTGGQRLKTFAEYIGKENNTLEAQRKKIWGK